MKGATGQQEDMFRSVTPPKKIGSKAYEQQVIDLRADLLKAQIDLGKTPRSIIVTIAGVDGAGKGEVIQLLNEWLDPRGLETHSFWNLENEVSQRPYQWRYWRALPPRGRLSIWFGGMYTDAIASCTQRESRSKWSQSNCKEIQAFEEMLRLDGTTHLKIWLHLGKSEQRKRLKDLTENPKLHWRATREDWKHHNLYDTYSEAAQHVLKCTHFPAAPWTVLDASEKPQRDISVGKALLACMERTVKGRRVGILQPTLEPSKKLQHNNQLDTVDLSQRLSGKAYQNSLLEWQARCHRLFWEAYDRSIPTVLVFEGWDAAGKGSAIKRVTGAIDARLYRIVCVGAPTDEENQFHYLWRFWKPLPAAGRVTLFDRSWYGRVLVERVEKFAKPEEWKRAYEEINAFEKQLLSQGTVLCKFWIHISPEKQMERFQKRLEVPYKRHKITDEDWRNREKWPAYEEAINEMIHRTDSPSAPWTVVAGNNKKFARIQILKTICGSLKKAVERHKG